MEQNQEPKDIRVKSEKFIDEFSNITSAKACAIMILFNALSKIIIGVLSMELLVIHLVLLQSINIVVKREYTKVTYRN